MWETRTHREEQTVELGRAIGIILRPGDMVFLLGELGSGKTRLAKGIVSAATGVSHHDVVSPTFTLINTFEGTFPVHHADLYRIQGDAVENIGLEDTVDQGGALVVEWAEKVRGFGSDPLAVTIYHAEDADTRRIVLEWDPSGSWDDRINRVVKSWQERL